MPGGLQMTHRTAAQTFMLGFGWFITFGSGILFHSYGILFLFTGLIGYELIISQSK